MLAMKRSSEVSNMCATLQDKNRRQPRVKPTETQLYGGRSSLTSTLSEQTQFETDPSSHNLTSAAAASAAICSNCSRV
jgi:hypothetical protein